MAIGSMEILPLQTRDRHATNFMPMFCCNGGVPWHATISLNVGGVVAVLCHRVVRLVTCGTMPLSCSQVPLDVHTAPTSLLFQALFACGHQISNKKVINTLTLMDLMTY
jgi:hypothetical protein